MHDVNGTLLKKGDRVMVECVVEDVYATDNGEYCNVTLRTARPMPPYEHGGTYTMNTRQTLLLRRPDEE